MAKQTTEKTKSDVPVSPLAMRPKEVAKALGLSERKLWGLTNQGLIPHFHVGKAVLYPVDGLLEWVKEQSRRANGEHGREKTAWSL